MKTHAKALFIITLLFINTTTFATTDSVLKELGWSRTGGNENIIHTKKGTTFDFYEATGFMIRMSESNPYEYDHIKKHGFIIKLGNRNLSRGGLNSTSSLEIMYKLDYCCEIYEEDALKGKFGKIYDKERVLSNFENELKNLKTIKGLSQNQKISYHMDEKVQSGRISITGGSVHYTEKNEDIFLQTMKTISNLLDEAILKTMNEKK